MFKVDEKQETTTTAAGSGSQRLLAMLESHKGYSMSKREAIKSLYEGDKRVAKDEHPADNQKVLHSFDSVVCNCWRHEDTRVVKDGDTVKVVGVRTAPGAKTMHPVVV